MPPGKKVRSAVVPLIFQAFSGGGCPFRRAGSPALRQPRWLTLQFSDRLCGKYANARGARYFALAAALLKRHQLLRHDAWRTGWHQSPATLENVQAQYDYHVCSNTVHR